MTINAAGWYLIGSGANATGTIGDLINSLIPQGSQTSIHEVVYCINNPWSKSQPFDDDAFQESDWVEKSLTSNVETNKGYWVLIMDFSDEVLSIVGLNGYISGETGKFYMKDKDLSDDFTEDDFQEMFITDENGEASLLYTRKNDIKDKLCKVVTTGEGSGVDITSEEEIKLPMENIFEGNEISNGETINITPLTTLKSELYKKYKAENSGSNDEQLLDESKDLIYNTFYYNMNDTPSERNEKRKYIDKDYANEYDSNLNIENAKTTMNISNKLSMVDTIIKQDVNDSLNKDDVMKVICDEIYKKRELLDKFNINNDIDLVYDTLTDGKISEDINSKGRIENGLKQTLEEFDNIISDDDEQNISEINKKIKITRKKSKKKIKETKDDNDKTISQTDDISNDLKPESDYDISNDIAYLPTKREKRKRPIEIAVEISNDGNDVKFFMVDKVYNGINYIETVFNDIPFNANSSYIFRRKNIEESNYLFAITTTNTTQVKIKLFAETYEEGIQNKDVLMLRISSTYNGTGDISYKILDTTGSEIGGEVSIMPVTESEVEMKKESILTTIIYDKGLSKDDITRFKFTFNHEYNDTTYLLSSTLKPNVLETTFDKSNHTPYIIKCKNPKFPIIINSNSALTSSKQHIKTFVSNNDENVVKLTVLSPSMSPNSNGHYFKILNKFGRNILDPDDFPELLMRGKSYKFVKHPQHVGSSLSHDFDVYFGIDSNKNDTKRGFSYYNVEDNIITVTIPSDADVDSVVNYFCPKHDNSMKGTIDISYKKLTIDSIDEEYEWFYGNMYPSPGVDLEIYVTGDFETANIFGYDIKNQSVIKTLMKDSVFKYKA